MARADKTKTSPAPENAAARLATSTVELDLPSSSAYLSLLRSTVEWYASRAGFTDKERGRITLAVVEAVTNIIRHAYGGDESQRITVRLAECEQGLEIELLDRGKCVPPAQLQPRKDADLSPGGLGVHMMKTCMDHFQYEPRPGGGSRLVLRKLRGNRAEAPPA